MSRTEYTAAKTLADLTGNPALESEIEAELARYDAFGGERRRAKTKPRKKANKPRRREVSGPKEAEEIIDRIVNSRFSDTVDSMRRLGIRKLAIELN